MPLCTVTGPKGAEELIKWIAHVGIPQEIVTDQRSNFKSQVMKNICQVLEIQHL